MPYGKGTYGTKVGRPKKKVVKKLVKKKKKKKFMSNVRNIVIPPNPHTDGQGSQGGGGA